MSSNFVAKEVEMVKTKNVDQRACSYKTLDDLSRDLDQIESWYSAGTLTCKGNWSEGMIFDHVAKVFSYSIDGYPFKFAAPMRKIVTLMFKKKIMAGAPFPAGIKPPPRFLYSGDVAAASPDNDFTFEQGIDSLRSVIARVENGERLTEPSPVLGPLTHEEGIRKHLAHAELHLSFLDNSG